jgi:rhodanese-related sulfurtransferase
MGFLRQYRAAVIAGSLVLLLVIIRLTGWNHFEKTAGDLQNETANQANIISLNNNQKNLPVIDIRSKEVYSAGHPDGAINIPMNNLLSGNNRKFLNSNRSGIILFSDDYALLSRAWSLLSQMGYKNIFIIGVAIETDEVLKYNFRPDSTVKPE